MPTTPRTSSASGSGSSSERRARPGAALAALGLAALGALASPGARAEPVAAAVAAPAAPAAPRAAAGKVFLTADEALALAFPKCEIERTTIYLGPEQLARAKELAGVEVEAAIARPWTARRDGRVVGHAWLDSHKVRTLSETILVATDPEGRVTRVELLSFAEPEEYVPRGNWYAQFVGRSLDDELKLKRAIRPVGGATLTAGATTDAVRRVLALQRTLRELPPRGGTSGGER